jgi:hypothetical protein
MRRIKRSTVGIIQSTVSYLYIMKKTFVCSTDKRTMVVILTRGLWLLCRFVVECHQEEYIIHGILNRL